MVKQTFIKKIKEIKAKLQNRGRKNLLKGLILFSGIAPAHNVISSTIEKDSDIENVKNSEKDKLLSLNDIRFAKDMVNIAPAHSPEYFEFENQIVDKNNNPISDFKHATKYSIWDCSYKRETGTQKNPVGSVGSFYGSLQFNRFNAENMAIYGMLHPEHKELAAKFFKKSAQLEKDLKNFQKSMKNYAKTDGDENLAYHVGSAARKKVVAHISPSFRKVFEKEGLENPLDFLDLQRDYAGEVYCSFDAKNLNKICAALKASHVKPEEVNPAIWGMFLAKHIKGGFGGISALLKGKKAKDINSLKFVNTVAGTYPSVFKQGSGKDAWKFAKEHYQEKHSLTTIKELSLILHRPELVQEYLHLLSMYREDSVTFEEAREMAKEDSLQEKSINFSDILQEKIEARNTQQAPSKAQVKINEILLAKNSRTR